MTIFRGKELTQAGVETDYVLTSELYTDPLFIQSLSGNKITGDIAGNAENINGIVSIPHGGTGQTTANDALNALLPVQTSNNGKVLYTNGTDASWQALTGSGNVSNAGTATDNAIARFDGTTGKIIQNSSASISDSGDVTTPVAYVKGIQLNTSTPSALNTPGEIRWNAGDATADLVMNSNVVQQIGLEQFYHVKNDSGYVIPNGTVVKAAGTLGNSGKILVNFAIADGTFPSRYIMGVATEDIAINGFGYITTFGLVRGLQTNGANYTEVWTDGTILWAHPTIPGGLTKTEPTAPNLKVVIAIVVNAHASNGSLFIRVAHNSNLHDLHDVEATAEANNDILIYNSTTSRWENNPPLVARDKLGLEIGVDIQPYNSATAYTSTAQTFTAKQTFGKSLAETQVAIGSNIDLSAGNLFTKTVTGSLTLTVSNVPASGIVSTFILELTNAGSNVTWWSGVKWAGGITPTLSAVGKDVLGFYSYDGGTTWNGFVMGLLVS